jgi:alkanesulfonate monooxygenase SsuD/methylene tetrahydromethanopterin reductase-like flavin-dependent oxidoreductase (luciferase family)
VRSALYLPIFGELAEPRAVAELAAEAEAAGWDGVFVWDHLAYRAPVVDVADPWVTSAAIAMATERVRLGPLVTPLARRRPAMIARETVTLDRLSGGRLTFGVGLGGDNSRELSGTGEELDDKVRARMLDEHLEVLEAAWSGEPVDHHGEHYTIDGVRFRPRPVQRPRIPIWVAVRYGNLRPLRRAARYDGVFPVDVDSPDQLAELVASVAELRGPAAAGTGYDVAIAFPPGTDPAPYAAAGTTWWLIDVDWQAPSLADVRALTKDGPPTLP